jgi:hypothetical protein
MKKVLSILPVLLLLSCGKLEKTAFDVCRLEVQINKVTGTKVWFDITPDNPNAVYTYGIVDESVEAYSMPAKEVAELQLDFMEVLYEVFSPLGTNVGSFSDVYLYKGAREFKDTDLEPDTGYRFFVMQVDPVTHKLIGDVEAVYFRTKPIDMADLSFEIVFSPDAVEVIPSNDQLSYYWDYEETDDIRENYYRPEYYFYYLVDMYEDYNFIENLLDIGPAQWQFSVDDKGMVEGKTYTLVVAGYDKGEINTDYTIVDFIYHKDSPIEVLDSQWEKEYEE